jgi:hypothetical protein
MHQIETGETKMGRTVIKESMFSEIIDLYNSQGRTAAYDLIRSKYGVKNPYSTLTRIKRSGIYTYDPDTDQFVGGVGKSSPDAVFMDLDELCGTSIVETGRCAGEETVIRRSSMEMLVRELINDRLLLLSRYITLDTSAKTVIIDQSSLSADGYRIVTH